nr:M20/M25/M40 family metallo-hydrolase [Patulibacter sp. SYSU D01012]
MPRIGHACGHNLIAAAAVGAGLALSDVADAAGLTVRVIGTPAEESGGGKAHLLDAGAFAGVDAAMMVHAGPQEVARFASFAHRALAARFVGARADAAAEAVSALVDALDARGPAGTRLRTTERPWGLDAAPPHLRPALPVRPGPARWVHAEARAADEPTLAGLTDGLRGVLHAAADEAGCALDVVDAEPPYRPFRTDDALAAAWARHAAALGRPAPADPGPFAMTDMGNVSHAVPAIHPMLALGDGTVTPHDPAFADLVVTPQADATILDAATAMAWTALDVAAGRAA